MLKNNLEAGLRPGWKLYTLGVYSLIISIEEF